MNIQLEDIVTDSTLRELKAHGNINYPFKYYYDDLKSFRRQCIEWHWHNEIEFVSVEKGPIDCLVGNKRIRLEKGDGIFINSGTIHRFEALQEGHMPNILFAPEFIAPSYSLVYKKYVYPILSSSYDYVVLHESKDWQRSILEHLELIYKEVHTQNQMMELQIQMLVGSMWSTFFQHIQNSLSSKNGEGNILKQSRLHIMLQFISEQYANHITLENIANAANISKSEALRCFHTGVSTTPVNYLIQYRLNRAMEMLLSTKDTITDITLTTGFDSIGYFCRMFKRTFGMTPNEFRKKKWRCSVGADYFNSGTRASNEGVIWDSSHFASGA